MSELYSAFPQGVCAHQFDFELDGTILLNMTVQGGCPGNLEGITRLITGLDARDVIGKLEGVTCGPRPTSCPDQIARALRSLLTQQGLLAVNTIQSGSHHD